jgi:hypothetical protein
MKKLWKNEEFQIWLAIVGTALFVIGAAYAMAQQSTRLAANDIPLWLNQTAKNSLNKGARPADAISGEVSNLESDSIPFVIITDKTGKVLASDALLNGKTPQIPKGVLAYTQKNGIDRITWEPADNVRLATVVSSYDKGFIIAGQSLKEPESRINTYTLIAIIAWIGVICFSTLILVIFP